MEQSLSQLGNVIRTVLRIANHDAHTLLTTTYIVRLSVALYDLACQAIVPVTAAFFLVSLTHIWAKDSVKVYLGHLFLCVQCVLLAKHVTRILSFSVWIHYVECVLNT